MKNSWLFLLLLSLKAMASSLQCDIPSDLISLVHLESNRVRTELNLQGKEIAWYNIKLTQMIPIDLALNPPRSSQAIDVQTYPNLRIEIEDSIAIKLFEGTEIICTLK